MSVFRPVLVLLATIASVCARPPAWPASDTLRASNMPAVLQYVGFDVSRPPFDGWFLWRSDQIPTEAVLRRDSSSDTTVPQVHLRIGTLPRTPRSAADFAELVRQDRIGATRDRKVLSYRQRPAWVRGQAAITFVLRMSDFHSSPRHRRRAGVQVSGYVVQHPSMRRVAISASFWESTSAERHDQQLAEEASRIMKNVAFTPIRHEQRSELGPLIY